MAAPRTCECGECPKCKHREYMNDYYRREPDRIRAIAAASRERRIDEIRAYDRGRGNRTPQDQARAHNAVRHEVEMGRMERPDACEECGGTPQPAVDGRSQIEAHHDDYSKLLEVRWLCKTCHMIEHRQVAA